MAFGGDVGGSGTTTSGSAAPTGAAPAKAARRAVALPPLPSNLDSLRGLACLLIVAYHVVGSDPARGLRLPATSDWHYAMTSLELLRLPIFTALSGYLYARWRPDAASFGRFWSKKLRRIALPLVALTLLTFAARTIIHAETKSIVDALTHGYEHLWYLQALLAIFLAISAWDAIRPPGALALTIATAVLIAAGQVIRPSMLFSMAGALYIAPFFCFGMVIALRQPLLVNRRAGLIGAGIALVAIALHQAGLHGLLPSLSPAVAKAGPIGMAGGLAGVVALLAFLPRIAPLATIGVESYPIYLWHVMFLAGTRLAMQATGIDAPLPLFVAGLIAGIGGPIALRHLLSHLPRLSTVLMGDDGRRHRRGREAPAGG